MNVSDFISFLIELATPYVMLFASTTPIATFLMALIVYNFRSISTNITFLGYFVSIFLNIKLLSRLFFQKIIFVHYYLLFVLGK